VDHIYGKPTSRKSRFSDQCTLIFAFVEGQFGRLWAMPKGSKEPKTHSEVGTKNPDHSTTLSNHASSGTKKRLAHPESPCCWHSKYDFRVRRTRMQVPSQLIQDGVSQESPILSLAVKHQHADPVGICRGGD